MLQAKIVKCSDSMMWYSNSIGKVIDIKRIDGDTYLTYDNEGYNNIVLIKDTVEYPQENNFETFANECYRWNDKQRKSRSASEIISREDLRNQLKLIQSEVDELKESIDNETNQEILEEFTDVMVTVVGFAQLLEKCGFDVMNGLASTNENNFTKFIDTSTLEGGIELSNTIEFYRDQGITVRAIGPMRAKVVVDVNNKIRKPVSYKKKNLSKFSEGAVLV